MQARDVMTTEVVSTTAETPVREVARPLLQHGISAMPVLDADGVPVGMVSEGDLVSRRRDGARGAARLVAQAGRRRRAPDGGYLAKLRAPDRTAGDVMSAPVVTVGEDTELTEVARLLAQHHTQAGAGGEGRTRGRHRQPRRPAARPRDPPDGRGAAATRARASAASCSK